MELNEVKYGFKLEEIKDVKDINATFYRFNHLKSGGTVVYLKTSDKNKTFAIGFKTLPYDSTGVCHIIEHSMLCGSKKYPVKEPFVDLLKGSLATFLNAFTSYDWTMYPCASQNNKDFNNIVDVYLDAVFHPRAVIADLAFRQEGWHLELNDPKGIPYYNGVVYNEMKGAMANVTERLIQTTNEAMYEGSGYAYNSGGEPSEIIKLSFEDYKKYYFEHYNPQNALTVFYGDLDIEEQLEHLSSYFDEYEKCDKTVEIDMPKPLINTTYEKEYSIGDEEPLQNNSYMSLCFALESHENLEEMLAMDILFDAIFGENGSPLKKKLLDAKLGDDLNYYIDDASILPAIHIHLEKAKSNVKQKFMDTFIDGVKELVTNGIDKRVLLASINRYEFKDKEQDKPGLPKGIDFAMKLMSGFNYHYDLVKNLEFSELYKKYHQELNNGYFEKLLEKYILNSKHYVEAVLHPSRTIAKEEKAAMDQKMAEIKKGLDKDGLNKLILENKELLKFKNAPDPKACLETLPRLKLTDIDKSVNYLVTRPFKYHKMQGIQHKINVQHISYVNVYFDLKHVDFNDLPYCFLLKEILLEVPTLHYDVAELNTLVKTYLGSFDINEVVVSKSKKNAKAMLKVSMSALDENVSYIPKLLTEVLLHSTFKKNEVMQVLRQSLNSVKQDLLTSGHVVASLMANASVSETSAIVAKGFRGPELYQFLSDLLKNFEINKVKQKLKELCYQIFNRDTATISFSGSDVSIKLCRIAMGKVKFFSKYYDDALKVELRKTKSQALVIPSDVSYNAVGFNLEDIDETMNGKYYVLSHIVNYDYLWTEVRLKGGAYGCFMNVGLNNNIALTSFRDSCVQNTYDVYKHLSTYLLSEFKPNQRAFKSYIIGAISNFDKPLTNSASIARGDVHYFLGVSEKDLKLLKKEVLGTKINDIRAFSDIVSRGMKHSSMFTIGNEEKIAKVDFDNVQHLK